MPHPIVQAIILAAGKSSRFNTQQSKLTFSICGQPMITYPVKALAALEIPTTVVIGHQKEEVIEALAQTNLPAEEARLVYIEQTEQRGTGHAVMCTRANWLHDHILVMNGDMPLVTQECLKQLIEQHTVTDAAVTFVTAHNVDPTIGGYGRVVTHDATIKIVEARDFSGDPHQACCINAGIYLFKRSFLETALDTLRPAENTQELYITDLIGYASNKGLPVATITVPFDTVRGINTLKELWVVEHIKRSELIEAWMNKGVFFSAPHTVSIDCDVQIGAHSRIEAGVHLTRGTKIGEHSSIGAFCHIDQSTLAEQVLVKPHSIITESIIGTQSQIGPFAHIRNQTIIGTRSVIGNFVEVSKSVVGHKTKIKHLSYIGNAHIGSQVNIGAGTIVCNYDGFSKHQTIIKDEVSIGSLNSIVAPVTINERAMTAAGSTITNDIPANALGIARARQTNKEGYAEHRRTAASGALRGARTLDPLQDPLIQK